MRPDLPHPRPHQASGSPFLHVPSSKVPSSPGLCPFVVRGEVRAEAAASGRALSSIHLHTSGRGSPETRRNSSKTSYFTGCSPPQLTETDLQAFFAADSV